MKKRLSVEEYNKLPEEEKKKFVFKFIDENMGIGEDIDYSYRVQKEGFTLAEMDFWFQHHQIRDTPHNPQSEDIKRKAELYFKEKHNIK